MYRMGGQGLHREWVLGLAMFLSWILAFVLRFYVIGGAELEPPGLYVPYLLFGLALSTCYVLLLYSYAGLRSGEWQRRQTTLRSAIGLSYLAVFIVIVLFYFFYNYRFSRATILLFLLLAPVVEWAFLRLAYAGESGQEMSTALVFSSTQVEKSEPLARLLGSGELNVQVQLDTDTLPSAHLATGGGMKAHIQDWLERVQSKRVLRLIVFPSYNNGALIEEVMTYTDGMFQEVVVVPHFHGTSPYMWSTAEFRGIPFLSLNETAQSEFAKALKRAVDLLGGVLAVLLFSPIMVTVALLLRLTDRGPVFFKQERVGLDGKHFQMLKFRTMRVQQNTSSQSEKAGWTTANDPRVTWLGRYLRSSSLDELPQLINVIRGDMSLVGPRPERPVFVDDFKTKVPGYMLRHKVKVGMTGWAQIHGWRGDTSIKKRIEFDLYYVRHWTVWLDIEILIKTVFYGFFNKNAY